MFKLLLPNGAFSLGGSPSEYDEKCVVGKYWCKIDNIVIAANKTGKRWNLASHLKSHLRLFEHYDYNQHKLISDIDKIEDCIVIEYEMVEKRRLTVKEFMEEQNANS